MGLRVMLVLAAMAACLAIGEARQSTSTPGAGLAASPGAAGQAPQDVSTLEDQADLSLTVYNSDLALVRDVRDVRLATGAHDLRFMDIAATVNPATVHLRSLTGPGALQVVEQNYEYDLLEPDKLLRKYVGRDVTLVRRVQRNGTTEEETVTARLISYNSAPVWQIGSEIVTGLQADHVRFPELPGNLFSRPTLIWTLDNQGPGRHRIEAAYLAGKLSWNADYVLTVGRDDRAADLDGWVTLTNGSGTAFPNASLQLVAGDVNRARQAFQDELVMRKEMAQSATGRMSEESFSEYHLYSLAHRTTINNNQTKQLSLLNGTGIPVRKRYSVDARAIYYRNPQHPGTPLKSDVQVRYELTNAAADGLGLPLPAGVVRVYQADTRGGVQFAGEDRIDHTPKDEVVGVTIGRAFDVVCERQQTDFQKIAASTYEVAYRITLRNHKASAITVDLNEPFGGTWQILSSSHRYTKTDAWAARFGVPVAADGTATVEYRVRVVY
jgi:hypothetical protein